MASPPPEAADGFDANAPPPTRTPDGDADLLPPSSPAVAPAPHLRDTPPSDVADLSIDDDTGVEGGDGGAVDDSPLEVNYGEDDDDDEEEEDDGEEGDEGAEDEEDGDTAVTDGTPVAGAGGSSSAAEALARRTDAIMSSYKDYIDEITSEPVEGDPTAALADLEMQNDGGDGESGFAYSADASDRTPPASNTSLADAPMPDDSDASTVGMGTVGRGGYMESVRDDASFEDFYGELSFHPRRNYRWPILRNRKFQVCCFGAVLGIVLLGVIAGVASRSIHPGGGVKVAGEESGDSGVGGGGGTLTDIVTTTKPISTAMPITTAIPTEDSSDAQSSNFNDDRPFDSLDPNNFPQVNGEQMQAKYVEAYDKYKPEWFDRSRGWTGQTYVQAVDFCSAREKMVVCPYDAICPLGPRSIPAGGLQLEGGASGSEQWAPVSNGLNIWVGIGVNDICVEYKGTPEWGVTGEGNEEITRYIVCCTTEEKADWPMEDSASTVGGDAVGGEDDSESAYFAADLKYQPTEYDRDDGWAGQTYLEAVAFCQVLDRAICPYAALCPLGSGKEPMGGFKPGDADTWSAWLPIVDAGNDWVQATEESGDPCVRYSSLHGEPPDWGITGEGNEETTRHVQCCVAADEDNGGGDATAARNPLSPEGRPNPNPDYEAIGRIYKPQWFGRTSGWTGNTYISALAFCAAEESMMLCPYKAICPHGKDTRPYGEHKSGEDEGLEIWAPLGDSLNAWVSLSAHDSCTLYRSMHENPPDWGLTGLTDKDVTPHVMCCELNAENEAGGVGNVGSGSTQQNNNLQQNMNTAKTPPTVPWPDFSLGTTVLPTAADNEYLSMPAFAYAKETYKPVPYDRFSGWTGQTYDAAFGFCASTSREGAALMLCPYEAVCPMGPMNRPYESFVGSGNNPDGDSWTPVSNEHNWWVQVGPNNPCVFYSILHDDEHPYWGVTGRGSEEITRHILCCDEHEVMKVIGTVKEPVEHLNDGTLVVVNDAYQYQQPPVEGKEEENPSSVTEIIDRYRPMWYHRGEGWEGSSYPEAIEFCSSHGMICPYEAYCPRGEGSTPFEGNNIADDISWAPISDRVNDWVSVGSKGRCGVWTSFGDDEGVDPPNWGMSGNEEMTRHLACCNTDNLVGGTSGTSVPGSQKSATESGDGPSSAVAIANFYQPKWFHRPDWSGASFQKAVDFCFQQTLVLCPYEALCPEGRGNPPFLTSYEEPSGSWAPITNSFNDWVRVSSEDGEPCARFSEEHGGDLPKWGTITEGGREDLTRHIMCCQTRAEDSGLHSAQQIMPEPDKHHLHWYDLDGGWTGATYDGAVQFCALNDSQIVCPVDAICPYVGGTRIPVGGVHDHEEEPGGAWAPVLDKYNEWIRVSSEDLCVLYSNVHGEEPDWGLHGEREDLTRHIACCNGDHPAVADALVDAVTPSGPQRPVDHISPGTSDNTLLPPEVMVIALYNPIWYIRDDGWDGTTWSRAVEYCITRNGALCPREAYCPDGQNLIRGEIDDGTNAEGWAPVSDAANEWVRVSLTSGDKCALWSSMHDAPPEWDGAEVGTAGEVVTRQVMCCTPIGSEEAEDVGVHDEMGPHLKPTTGVATTTATTTTTTTTTTMATTTAMSEVTTATKTEAMATAETEGTQSTNEATAHAPTDSVLASQTFLQAEKKYLAKWYDRSMGWKGRTYAEALKFCAEKGSSVPCPYQAYCPIGPGTHVMGGMRTEKTFAPIIDTPNGWVSVGPDDTCATHNALAPPPEWGLTGLGNEEITRYILCCHEPEDGFGIALLDERPIIDPTFDVGVERSSSELAVMDIYHPLWYGRRHGYHGGSLADAERFCANVGGKRLCPEAAYCPNGVATQAGHKVLFLDRMAFEGEQWAPISDDGTGHNWVMVGTVGGFPTSTCATYGSLKDLSTWVGSDKPSVHKQHVLCCADEKVVNQVETIEQIIKEQMKPVWFDEIDGWTGGSWGDAALFCQGHGGRELCPYATYCPYGNGKHVMGGHRYNFDAEGEQWAPFSGVPNSWVMIGQKYQNSATTCMTFEWLEGKSPGQWGNVNAMSELKRHIMCCMPEDGS